MAECERRQGAAASPADPEDALDEGALMKEFLVRSERHAEGLVDQDS